MADRVEKVGHIGGQVPLAGSGSVGTGGSADLTVTGPNTKAHAETALGRPRKLDPTVVVVNRIAERHLTVLADRTSNGGLLIRLVDEADAREIGGFYVAESGADDDDLVVELALDIVRILKESPSS